MKSVGIPTEKSKNEDNRGREFAKCQTVRVMIYVRYKAKDAIKYSELP